MKQIVLGLTLLLGSLAVAQQGLPPGLEIPSNMKQYFVAFLIESGNTSAPKEPDPATVKAHLAMVRANIESGKYALAGPFTDGERIGGMFIINAATKEEAQQLVSADPMVKSGFATIEFHAAMFPDLTSLKVSYPPKQSQ
jgi:uncharacterized protein YciI